MHGENAELKDEVTELARKYSIVTPYTAYLIIEDEARRGVPILSQTLPQLQQDTKAREATTLYYNRQMMERSGLAPTARSRSELALKSANAPADAVTLGNNESLNGLGGGAVVGATSVPRVYVAGSPVAARSEAERLAEYTQQTQFVGGRSFYQNGNQWIDAAIQKLKDPKRIRVQLNSKEYFDLVARKSEARPWLALGQNVQFVLNGTVYEIYDN